VIRSEEVKRKCESESIGRIRKEVVIQRLKNKGGEI